MNYSNNSNNNNQETKYNKSVLMNGDVLIGFINIDKTHFGGKDLSNEEVINLLNNCDIKPQEKQAVVQLNDLLVAK